MSAQYLERSLTLYHYWRSSCSWRVRWALNYKGIAFDTVAVNLLEGEQTGAGHQKRNPLGLVPTLEIAENGRSNFLSESMAIILWLERVAPLPALFPSDPLDSAKVIQLCEIINAGTQPLQNLGVMKDAAMGADGTEDLSKKAAWAKKWITRGLKAYETQAAATTGAFSVGDQITAADLFLVPQIYNALRFEIDLQPFPTCNRAYQNALKTESYLASEPSRFEPKG